MGATPQIPPYIVNQARSNKPPTVKAQVVAKRTQGLPKSQIARDLKISRPTVDKILAEARLDCAPSATWNPEQVKGEIRDRLLGDIRRGKSSGVAREAELLGRDKTVDMWVRPADVQIGIFNALQGDSAAILDQLEPGELIQASTTPALPADTPDQP